MLPVGLDLTVARMPTAKTKTTTKKVGAKALAIIGDPRRADVFARRVSADGEVFYSVETTGV